MKHKFLTSLLALAAAAAVPDTAPAASSISQFGITWTFDKDYPAGQFANGDWWVVGPVKIVSFTPASASSEGRTINGSMINPPVGKAQGYDSATYATYGQSYSGNVAAGVSAANPLTVSPGSSLVSSISHTTAGNRPQLTSAAVLTVLSAAAPAGSFRPPYTGADKTLYWNKSQLRYSLLRSLPKVANTPLLSTVEAYFERPWLEHNTDWTGRYIHPSGNMPDYGRDMANALAEGLLSLQLDYTQAQKEKLLIRLVQYGIDVYGVAKSGGIWYDNGGHGQGRKMPMILAGMMLNDQNILSLADGPKLKFQEDRQTWYVRTYDVGRPLYHDDGRPRVEYISSDVGVPEWGEQHTRNETRDGRNWDAYYRNVVGHSILGHILTARLMDAQSAWNWPAVFEYADRYWNAEKSTPTGGGNAIRPFVHAMWTAYRSSTPPANTPPSITTQPGNATVQAGQTATFSVTATGSGTLSYQWQRNGAAISGATSPTYTTPITTTSDNGNGFRVVVSNSLGSATSNTATLTVNAAAPGWINQSFPAQTGTFNVEFDAVPTQAGIDSIIALSNGPADAYTDLACIVRFNTSNSIDARNGGAYTAQTAVSYSTGTSYHFRLVVRVPQHTYDIYVKPGSGTELLLGQNYVFRTEQSAVASLSNCAEYHAIGNGAVVTNFSAGSQIVTIDNSDPSGVTITGTWTASTSTAGYLGANYLTDGNSGKGSKSVRFTPNLSSSGAYEVFGRWTSHSNRAANVPVDIVAATETVLLEINQQLDGGEWIPLGTYNFNAGTGGSVVISNAGTSGYVIADAVKFVKVQSTVALTGGDIGSVGVPGSTSFDANNTAYTLKGSGADIWGTVDAFHFARNSVKLSGDGSIVARVQSMTNTNAWAKAGVMIRETTAANSKHAMLIVSPQNGVSFQSRSVTGSNSESATMAGIVAPVWVKLTRTGASFTAFYSSDGVNWTQVGTSRSIAMAADVEIGLAVCSRSNTNLCTGVFTDVSITP